MSDKFYKYFFRDSLLKRSVLHTSLVMLFILLASLWLSYDYYKIYQSEQIDLVHQEAKQITSIIDEKLIYIESVMRYIANKITLHPNNNPKEIAQILSHHPKLFEGGSFGWNSISFITPQGALVANSIHAAYSNPEILTKDSREWIKTAKAHPWHLKYSSPIYSSLNGLKVIPLGMGISAGTFLGYLTIEVEVEKVIESLKNVTKDDVGFIIYDSNGEYIFSSTADIDRDFNAIPKDLIKQVKRPYQLKNPIEVGDHSMIYATYLSKVPFIVFIGHHSKRIHDNFYKQLLPRVISYLVIGLAFIFVYGLFIYRILNPIMTLNRMAGCISKGEDFEYLQTQIFEFDNLAFQLSRINLITKDLRAKQAQLSKSNVDLENANSFIKSNMSFLSHELINPISTIIGFSELIQQKLIKNKDPELKEYLDILFRASIHQKRQLDYFLKLFKFQESKKKIEPKEVLIRELADWNISMVMQQAIIKRVKISVEIKQDLLVLVDDIMLGQIIQNFASNGIKYNKEGGELYIRIYSNHKDLIIEVEDTGVGISKYDLTKLFQKFSRIKESQKIVGYGVGLLYAKQCVFAHGGKIRIKSKVSHGTNFIITIPQVVLKTI